MRPDPIEIAFGDQKFTIKPLTIAQIRKIEKAVSAPDSVAGDIPFTVIGIALSRDHGNVVLDDLESETGEIIAAFNAILQLGGFKKAEPGEGAGAPTPNATGA
ncbi:hypothetical protein OGR47_02680 [Methylocystis sp. MJC1]|uniref:hypothetical protein n=1 Tax=Methylocystis sp. MJC1 TaxID=2654282 RepID=UPI0013ECDB18|nr:hypothetical protein [Methylocystis sp. MJC1]KAF2991158.1 hypothetical protein MJC1_01891 [Methylocystis sp. MJC1]MBU6525919.1 hypothetical protein [Methylocystis sp. MJC1]UZX12385.1 hypothetical protein OGR47_02680 [Methylocystis sp. MJC1]